MQHTFPAPAGFEQVPVFAAEDVAAAALQPFRYDRDASQTSTDFGRVGFLTFKDFYWRYRTKSRLPSKR